MGDARQGRTPAERSAAALEGIEKILAAMHEERIGSNSAMIAALESLAESRREGRPAPAAHTPAQHQPPNGNGRGQHPGGGRKPSRYAGMQVGDPCPDNCGDHLQASRFGPDPYCLKCYKREQDAKKGGGHSGY